MNASALRTYHPCCIQKQELVSLHSMRSARYQEVGKGPEMGSVIGRKLPTIKAGLEICQQRHIHGGTKTYIPHISRFTVKEKQQRISGSFEFRSGFLRAQLVNIAFCLVSKAMAPNFSQYETNDESAMISWRAIFPF